MGSDKPPQCRVTVWRNLVARPADVEGWTGQRRPEATMWDWWLRLGTGPNGVKCYVT